MANGTLADRIRSVREERGMSVAELARILRVSYAAVWNWEKGTQPRHEVLLSLAKALGVSAECLLSGAAANGNEKAAKVTVAEIIANAQSQIAGIMGLPPDRVKVQVEFATA